MTAAEMAEWEEAGGKAIFRASGTMAEGPYLDAAWRGITEAARARFRMKARAVIACQPRQPVAEPKQGVLFA